MTTHISFGNLVNIARSCGAALVRKIDVGGILCEVDREDIRTIIIAGKLGDPTAADSNLIQDVVFLGRFDPVDIVRIYRNSPGDHIEIRIICKKYVGPDCPLQSEKAIFPLHGLAT